MDILNIVNQTKRVKLIFDEIKNAKGKDKEIYIQAAIEDPIGEGILRLLFDNSVVTNVGKTFKDKTIDDFENVSAEFIEDEEEVKTLFQLMKYLNDRGKSVNNSDLKVLILIRNSFSVNEQKEFFNDLITKELSLGISAKTINKVVGYQLIPEFGVMLSDKFVNCSDVVKGKKFTVTEKLDGNRCFAVVKEFGAKLYTRQGNPYDGLTEIESELYQLRAKLGFNFCLDGEIIVENRDRYPSKEQFKQTSKILRTDGEKTGLVFHVFDYLSIDEYENKKGTRPYWVRRDLLDNYVVGLPHVIAVPVLYSGENMEMLYKLLEEQRKLGHEGIMINLDGEAYEFKRTKNLLKFKVMSDCDLKIIGMNRGVGKFKDTLGSLIVDYKGNEVGVGSGIDDCTRKMMWSDRDKYIGRIATIQYFEETTDANGKPSLRFPVFKTLRDDKTEPSYS